MLRVDFRSSIGFQRKSITEGYIQIFGGSRTEPAASPDWQREVSLGLRRRWVRIPRCQRGCPLDHHPQSRSRADGVTPLGLHTGFLRVGTPGRYGRASNAACR